MSRLNGRLPQGIMGNPSERDNDFEPSCLVRTPSGNVYIPSDYKSNSSCSSPSKGDIQKNSDRCGLPFGTPVPVLPVRNNLRRPNSSHFPQSRFQFRKGFTTKCSWKCTAIIFIILSVVLCAALTYMSAVNLLNWSYQSAKACTVLVGENSEVFPPKSSIETNRTSSRNRPAAGGKYAKLVDSSDTQHLNRWRRDVDNQHGRLELDTVAHEHQVDPVIEHVNSNHSFSLHETDLNTTSDNENLKETKHAFVSAPLIINVPKINFTILDDDHHLSMKEEPKHSSEVRNVPLHESSQDAGTQSDTSGHQSKTLDNNSVDFDGLAEDSATSQPKINEVEADHSDLVLLEQATKKLDLDKFHSEIPYNKDEEKNSSSTMHVDIVQQTVNVSQKSDKAVPVNSKLVNTLEKESIVLPFNTNQNNSHLNREGLLEEVSVKTPETTQQVTDANYTAPGVQLPDKLSVEKLVKNKTSEMNIEKTFPSTEKNSGSEKFESLKSIQKSPDIVTEHTAMNEGIHPALTNTTDIIHNSSNSTPEKIKGSESSAMTSAESIQHDDPVYSYGQEEIEIVNLNHESATLKVSRNEIQHTSPDANKLNNDLDDHLLNLDTTGKTNIVNSSPSLDGSSLHLRNDAVHKINTQLERNIGGVEWESEDSLRKHVPVLAESVSNNTVPVNDSLTASRTQVGHSNATHSHPAKRVFVNVTIDTDEQSNSHKPVYVLSVSVPSSEDDDNRVEIHPPSQKSAVVSLGVDETKPIATSGKFTTLAPHYLWGGVCECSCPCLDNAKVTNDVSTESELEDSSQMITGSVGLTNLTAEKLQQNIEVVQVYGNEENISSIPETLNETSTLEIDEITASPLPEMTTQEVGFSEIPTELIGGSIDDDNSSTSVVPISVEVSTTTATTTTTTTTEAPSCPKVTPEPPLILILEGAKTFPARTFPPDGTTFSQIVLGTKLSKEIPPYSYWNMQFYQSESAYVKFDYSIPRGASIGVYARRNALPTHTQYDILEVLSGFKARTTRGSHPMVKKEVTHFMEPGHWFLSLYNDDGDAQEVAFIAVVAEDMTSNCPNGCSGKGECLLGHCQCNAGFGGEDCGESVCPVLCSQRGEYINGECQCNPGWKGKECSLRHDECEVPDCNGHGHCVNGKCACVRGYMGKFCEDVDCPHPTCSGHGFCAEGVCICKKGWKGADCSQMDNDALQCLPDCSGHGNFNLETQTCNCEPMWSGDDCSRELCDLDCGSHGHCVGEACMCNVGWAGEYCNLKQCDPRCNEHGQCKNGTCLCVTGWNGRHCTMEGCPNGCSGHGQCRVNNEGAWECRCYEAWDGRDCSTPLEQSCSDSRDNDKDGLVDCEDPECCSNHLCRSSQLCVTAPKPIDILLRKQPPAITASFFERMKFLIEEGSLQNYAKQESFNESRSAVVRGRVTTQMGMGLMGVRVSTATPLEGFTLTREDGWFDLLVNGGGTVTLQFGRSPFRPQTYIVNVPWNEVVIIDTVVMGMGDDRNVPQVPYSCAVHDYDLMKPVVLATWKHNFQGACPDKSAILAESQVVQESLQIPGTGLNLVYHSSRAAGYLSTIQLQLTPETIPPSLKLIHLRITIEGILFEKVFEADPVIKFTYAWNRLNVYRQRVYGVTTAMVKVGYEYSDCRDVIWDVQTTKLSGHDMSISEVGGWNLDIHHRYNFHEGILQKGDGSNIYLKHKPRVILTTMGDGHQRPLDCAECDGQASKQRLLAPVALATAPDGSIFVGDFNLVRKILVDGTVRTLVRLNATRVSYRYHLTLSPLDGILYISDPESHQIIRVRSVDDFSDPDHNWETAVGSGERCLPGDEAHCGDGALARDAKLAYPKGVAVSADNVLYFADGTNIRMVDRDGIVTTIIGNHMHKSHWKPIPCEGTLNVEEVHLRWPTELAINPLDNSLHIIDDHMILQLAPDGRVKVVAGRPLHCPSPVGGYDTELATHATLVMPQSITFGPSGDLYVAESDSQRINRVRVIATDGKISHFAGAESKCNCLDRGCDCFEQDHYLASTSKFNTISSVAVTPDGILHIGDQANYRIRSVTASIPEASGAREYEIFSPDTQEIYVFNRFGQHIATKNILTGETSYLFTYNVNTSNGKLSTVTDTAGNKVFLLRDYSSQVNSIENTKGQKCRLRMSRMKLLQELTTPDNYNVTFDYHGPATGLLRTKLDSTGRSYVYNYDEFGRLTSAVTPTGRVIGLSFDLSVKGATVKITQDNRKPVSMLIKGSSVVTKIGESEYRTVVGLDGSVSSAAPWGHVTNTDTVPYTILGDRDPVLAESFPVPAKQKTEIGGDLANRFEWRYFLRRAGSKGAGGKGANKAVVQVGRKLRVNGENLVTLEYDRETGTVAAFMDDRVELLNVTYDRTARPIKWGPRNGIFSGVELEYDRFSRLIAWRWGELTETYGFDRAGRLSEIKYADGSSMIYAFKDMFSSLPLKVSTPRGSDYLLQYDEAGALQSLTTPRGHIHTFSLQTSLGFFKYLYFSPVSRHPYEILFNDDGQILAKVFPHQSGKVTYIYDDNGKLDTILDGLSSTSYVYQESSGLVKSATIVEPNFELKQEFKHHAGILKDEKLKFVPKSGFDNAHFKYQYDGNARISGIDVEIAGKELPQLRLKYNQNLGMLEGISDLRIYRNTFNRSVMQDTSKQFFMITEYDSHGRVKSVLVNIKSFDVYRLELEYDNRNRIKSSKSVVGRTTTADKMTYNADGHVMEVTGDSNWKYVYDENGNVIGVIQRGEKITLGYDAGDRVVQYGDVELNSYDGRGFAVRRGEQKYRFDSRGKLIHAFEHDKFQTWYHYDERDRLIAWRDARGNVTQYFYANPTTPNLVTHLHFPKTSRTFRLLYDEKQLLVGVETSEQRFYVASDQNGSPVALFDTNGNIIKEIRRTPFGKVTKDSNPDFYLPVDFHGGLLDPNTGLVYLNKRLYDPQVGQWMTPAWEQLANHFTTPTDVFIYRFNNNDPINPSRNITYMTDLDSWLRLYGYDTNNMLGSAYTNSMVYRPSASITSPQLFPDLGATSGLQCIVDKVNAKFRAPGFVPGPLLKTEPTVRNLLPRVAYRRAVFGEALLISRVNNRALVSVVEGTNGVVQDVITSVLNNSYFLDLHFSLHDRDVFYFVKENVLKMRDDREEFKRLGSMFNVTMAHEEGGGGGGELRLHSPDAAVLVRYGVDPEVERHRLLKHAHKRAVERAWQIEKVLVAAGLRGRTDWTVEEREELLLHGSVAGYEGVDVHGIHKYPLIADDPGNVAFRRDNKRKRRAQRTQRHKTS